MKTADFNLRDMQADIEKIEQHALKLKASGGGIPVVEKNIRIILSVVHNLKFGIVDPAAVMDE